jgi:hypothetical protein
MKPLSVSLSSAAIAAALCSVVGYSQTQIHITLTDSIPPSVENGTKQFFRPLFEQQGQESCGNANAIGYVFTYEIDCARNLAASASGNQYSYVYTYSFLNDGSEWNGSSHMYVDAMNIVKENGIPNVTDWGGFTAGYPTKWISGYDYYYRGMQNRVEAIDSFLINDSTGLRKLKQWVFNHGNGSPDGGLALYAMSVFNWQFAKITSGPQSGQTIALLYGNLAQGDHTQTVIGYNDSVRYDFNKDGKFTNTGGMGNWEVGALHAANTWGVSGDVGYTYWCPYRLLTLSQDNGGLRNGSRATIISVKKTYTPKMAFKLSITHSHRKEIALSVGVAPTQDASQPTKVRKFARQFTYAGGDFPMCGQNSSSTIEIGLDVSDLIDSLSRASAATFFLIVQSQGGNTGTVNSMSLMDYTSGAVHEIKSTQTNVKINANATTYVKVSTDVTGVIPDKRQPLSAGRVEVRRSGGVFQIRGLWSEGARIEVITIDGAIKASFASAACGTWISLPRQLSAGYYFVRFTLKNGSYETRKVTLR